VEGYDMRMYPPSPRSVTRARRRTAEVVAKWGHPGEAGDAALVISELASNAVLHGRVAGRLFRVEVALAEGTLRLAVTDARGERGLRARAAGEDDESGRGLLIVSGLAARWDVEDLGVGKRVWAELLLGASTAATG
jgi:anti-sigma regulatory factor (Ser/Thr protein kinase)